MSDSKHDKRVDRKRKPNERERRSVRREARRRERDRRVRNRPRRIQYRLRDRVGLPRDEPMLRASNIHYELSEQARGLGPGGIGAMHLLARRTGLIKRIDEELKLLKVHLPYQPVVKVIPSVKRAHFS